MLADGSSPGSLGINPIDPQGLNLLATANPASPSVLLSGSFAMAAFNRLRPRQALVDTREGVLREKLHHLNPSKLAIAHDHAPEERGKDVQPGRPR
jgi:hypothetical protein